MLLCVLHGKAVGAPYKYDAEKELSDAMAALSEARYVYGKPEIFVQYSSDSFLPKGLFPDEVQYRMYSAMGRRDAKVDYYTKPGWFFKGKFVIRRLHIYTAGDKLIKYSIYTDEKNRIKWFVRHVPFKVIETSDEGNKETRVLQWLVFNGHGELYNRREEKVFIDHKRAIASFESTLYDAHGEAMSRKSGDMDYDSNFGSGRE
jgi:hypothetical protein